MVAAAELIEEQRSGTERERKMDRGRLIGGRGLMDRDLGKHGEQENKDAGGSEVFESESKSAQAGIAKTRTLVFESESAQAWLLITTSLCFSSEFLMCLYGDIQAHQGLFSIQNSAYLEILMCL